MYAITGTRLSELMQADGLSQRALSDQIGLNRSTVAKYLAQGDAPLPSFASRAFMHFFNARAYAAAEVMLRATIEAVKTAE